MSALPAKGEPATSLKAAPLPLRPVGVKGHISHRRSSPPNRMQKTIMDFRKMRKQSIGGASKVVLPQARDRASRHALNSN